MAGPKDLDPSSSPRALLGAELRHAREKKRLIQEQLGQVLFVSGSFVGQLEAGTRRMQPEIARMLDEILETDGFFLRNCQSSGQVQVPGPLRRGGGARSSSHGHPAVHPASDPGTAPDRRLRTCGELGLRPHCDGRGHRSLGEQPNGSYPSARTPSKTDGVGGD